MNNHCCMNCDDPLHVQVAAQAVAPSRGQYRAAPNLPPGAVGRVRREMSVQDVSSSLEQPMCRLGEPQAVAAGSLGHAEPVARPLRSMQFRLSAFPDACSARASCLTV